MPNPTPTAPSPKDDTTPTDTTPTTTAAAALDVAAGAEITTATSADSAPGTANGSAGDPGVRRTRISELEDRVWAALRRHPGGTAAELASEASASRSAVGKLLAAWAAEGSATSTPGAKPRDARRWTAAPTHPAARAERVTGPDTAPPDNGSGTNVAAADPATADTSPAAAPVAGAATTDTRADTAEAAVSATTNDGGIGNDCDAIEGSTQRDGAAEHNEARESDEAREGDCARKEPRTTAAARREAGHEVHPDPGRPPISPASPPTSPLSRNRSGSTRLPKGGLRGQVEDYLADTAGEHSPVEIGKVLGRSSGAIANALESLVESGDAVRTWERPRRYSHPDHADAVDHTGLGEGDGADADRGRARMRGPGRGVCGVGTYVTVLAVLPLDSIDAISTDEIAERVRTQMPAPVLFAAAAHGVTRAALSAGAEPADWPTPTPTSADTPAHTTGVIPAETIGHGDAETGDGSGRVDHRGDHRVDSHSATGGDPPAGGAEPGRSESAADSGGES